MGAVVLRNLGEEISGPQVQLFPLHKVMKYFLGGGCCNSLEENESQILKGWQMVDAGNVFYPVL